jgi:hypothetical protein
MDMRNLFIIFNIFLTVSNGCDGCKDEEPQPTKCNGYIEFPQLLKDYFLFKDSSYWIYKDSVTGTLDSFWVIDYKKESYWPYRITGTRYCPCYEILEYKIKKSNYYKMERVFLQPFHFNTVKESDQRYFVRFDLINNSNSQLFKTEDRFISIGIDSIFNETPNVGGYIYKLHQIEVNNKLYFDIQFLNYPNSNPYDWVHRIYYAKNIGAIKFEDEDGRVWELVRHHVKQ